MSLQMRSILINRIVLSRKKPDKLFSCFDPGKNKEHSQCDMLDNNGILPTNIDDEQLHIKCMTV